MRPRQQLFGARGAFSFAAASLAATALSSGFAQAETGDANRGRALAQEWCARCHAIAREQERPGETDVPPFTRIAADPRWTREELIHMITVPHMQMPPPVLTRSEAEHVAAYILSLRR
ncbi:MAG TPA: cytochrome c [Alphaproteobacteria bacterium]|jgi:mono/diheme cytochrome c family protein